MSDVEEPTIAENRVLTKYKTAADIVNSKLIENYLVTYK